MTEAEKALNRLLFESGCSPATGHPFEDEIRIIRDALRQANALAHEAYRCGRNDAHDPEKVKAAREGWQHLDTCLECDMVGHDDSRMRRRCCRKALDDIAAVLPPEEK